MSPLVFALGFAAHAGPYEDGVTALRDGRSADALVALSAATEAEPGRTEAWWERGWASWNLGDLAGAARAWEQVEALDPAHPELGLWLAAARTRALLAGIDPGRPEIPITPEGPRLRVIAGGDTMMGSDLRKGPAGLPPGDGDALFDGVRGLLTGADLTFLNLEGPLADGLPSSKCGPGSASCYAFRTPTRFGGALKRAGVDVVSLANNHASDLGAIGHEATMKALDAIGIAHAGRYGDTGSLTVNGVSVALVAAHSGSCCLNVNALDEVRAAVALADRDHDLVIFSFHGGAEGASARHVPGKTEIAWGEQRGDVKALARAAIDAGADLVLGHGPHVLRAMEVYRGRLVAYSLGNFMGYRQFGTAGGFGGTTVLLEVELAANGALIAARLHPIALDADSVPGPDPTGAGWKHVAELSAADFPDTGVRVSEDGALSWGPR